jgi:hypothetical protein
MTAEILGAMAAAHGTDKNGRHAYTQHYGRHLDQLRETAFNLLEIGVGGYEDPLEGGRSLRTWKDYFPLANIVGLDFYDKSAMSEDRIKIYQGSQADPKVISKILSDYDSFRVIIDDGSHRSEHVISTLLMLWQYVEPGGWYILLAHVWRGLLRKKLAADLHGIPEKSRRWSELVRNTSTDLFSDGVRQDFGWNAFLSKSCISSKGRQHKGKRLRSRKSVPGPVIRWRRGTPLLVRERRCLGAQPARPLFL